MSFDDVNREIASSGGGWFKLTKKAHGVLKGKIVNVKVRDKEYQGKPVKSAKSGEVRKEWIFTLTDPEGNTVNWAAVESAQFAIRGALNGRKLEPGGFLQIAVVEDSVQGTKSAEYKAKYDGPVADDPFEGVQDTPPPADEPEEDPFA